MARVKAYISRFEKLTSYEPIRHRNVIEYGALRIDEDARQVYKNGVEIGFTSKEFEAIDVDIVAVLDELTAIGEETQP